MKNIEMIERTDRFLTGNPKLDNERLKLVDLYNEMTVCVMENPDYELFEKILHLFTFIARKYFKLEEEIFTKQNFPKKNVHTALHSSFLYQLDVYRIEVSTGSSINPYQVADYIKNWWENHSLKEDSLHIKYNEHLLQKLTIQKKPLIRVNNRVEK